MPVTNLSTHSLLIHHELKRLSNDEVLFVAGLHLDRWQMWVEAWRGVAQLTRTGWMLCPAL